jgi:primosomal protein N' (replication factor Y)
VIVQVALPGPFLQPLDYKLNLEAVGLGLAGCRVWVPFRNTKRLGVVVRCVEQSEYPPDKLKNVLSVLDDRPILDANQLRFLLWAADYYREPIGEVIQSALPKLLREGADWVAEGVEYWSVTDLGNQIAPEDLAKRAHKQIAVWRWIHTHTTFNADQIGVAFEGWRPLIKRWVDQAWLIRRQGSCLENKPIPLLVKPELNAEQKRAVEGVCNALGTFQPFLLQGVTGSGKTEVYLACIEKVLALGKQVLVLVPEIGLTPQTAERFERYLQQPVVAWHSDLTDSQRHCAWYAIKTGQASVLLGTRSALFAGFENLGLCIIDEEHDLSFKQQDHFRYSARDLIVRLAQIWQVPVVLGSATPSLEALHNVQRHRFLPLTLTQRAGGALLPPIHLLDIRGQGLVEGLSNRLKHLMQVHLQKNGQVLLFLNRRGYAPVLMCRDCGWQATCPSCDANLTYHQRSQQLRCHHCGFSTQAVRVCPDCSSHEFVPVGQGTERLEKVIKDWFPDKVCLRIDRDTTRAKGSLEQKMQTARSGEADILIGTQMLSKGHHFPKVTLVGLLDLDQGLFSVDFRAAERMAQLIIQVAGRAGRAEQPGEVWIQTYHPDHPLLNRLIAKGYEAFAKQALIERSQASLPPFSYQMLLRAEAFEAESAMAFLQQVKLALLGVAVDSPCEVWGPVSAPMERKQGRFRYQLLMQSQDRKSLQAWWRQIEPQVYAMKGLNKLRWSLDVDPQDLS